MSSRPLGLVAASVLLPLVTPAASLVADGPAAEAAHSTWQVRATQAISASEYLPTPRVTDGALAWHAANRAQNLRANFTSEGFRATPRVAGDGRSKPWSFGLATTAWGRAGAMNTVDRTEPTFDGARLSYVRGAMTEWYRNDARGVEQGFTITEAPAAGGALRVEMEITGTLRPRVGANGDVVDLVTARGELVLRLDGLHTFDATGRTLPSSFTADGSVLAIDVDDRNAVYPIVIDPTVTNPSWSLEGTQLGANIGYCVAGAGDVNGDGFDDVLIGAPFFDNGALDEGRVFLFYGSSLGLGDVPDWFVNGGQALSNLGLSVAGAGDVNGDGFADVLAGAPSYDNGQSNEGRAVVYYGSASGPGTVPNWTAESNQASAFFGVAVAGAGDVNGDGFGDVVVGASRYDNGQSDEGRAYLYLGSSAGLNTSAAWTAEPNVIGAHYGTSVAGAGDVNGDGFDDVIVGAPEFAGGQTDEGRAYFYPGSASGLHSPATWTYESNQAGARYGNAVAGAGDVNGDGYDDLVVGAYLYDAPQTDEGRVFVYHGGINGPGLGTSWTVESDQPNANLGTSVASAGDVNGDGFDDVVLGAFGYDDSFQNEGRVVVYEGSWIGLAASPVWIANGNQSGAFLGTSVASAGDVNGDGASDVLAGAPYLNGATGDDGGAYLYLGVPPIAFGDLNGDGIVGAADLGILLGAWGEFGGAADLNGDGIVDPADLGLLLGAWGN